MQCVKCGRPLDAETGKCPHCDGPEENVRILTPEEKSSYQGVTIDTDGGAEEETRARRSAFESGRRRIYIRNVNVSQSDWLTKLIVFAVVAAIAAFLLFIALPVALVGIGIAVLVWIVLSFFQS